MKISFSGGASKGLGYFRVLREIESKNISFEVISGTSIGSILGGALAMGMPTEEMKDLLISLPGDKMMRWANDVEKKKGNIITRIWKTISVILYVQFYMSFKMNRLFKKIFNWEKCKTKFYCCSYPLNDLPEDLVKSIKKSKGFTNTKKLVESLKKEMVPMYFSDDGVYEYKDNKFTKISNSVVPMWKAIRASFWTPPFKFLRVKIDGKLYTMFDGGVVNNHCNLVYPDSDYIQIAVGKAPKRAKSPSDKNYLKNPTNVYHKVAAKSKELGFFSFNDEVVNQEYNRKQTDIF